jgi:hypothetical protein
MSERTRAQVEKTVIDTDTNAAAEIEKQFDDSNWTSAKCTKKSSEKHSQQKTVSDNDTRRNENRDATRSPDSSQQ